MEQERQIEVFNKGKNENKFQETVDILYLLCLEIFSFKFLVLERLGVIRNFSVGGTVNGVVTCVQKLLLF